MALASKPFLNTSITVERNGSSIPFVSGNYARDAGEVAPTWNIELKHPVNLAADDTWTIKRGFVDFEQTLIDEATADSISGNDGTDGNTRSITGRSEVEDLLEYVTPKIIVFVNPDWLQNVAPDCYLKNNIIQRRYEGIGVGSEDYSLRFYHPRLPRKDVKDDEFICVVGPRTHHEIGKFIAQWVGFTLNVNTPDMTLVDTYTIPQGTTWLKAITTNFEIWSPNIEVIGTNIVIADIINEDGEICELQRLRFENLSIFDVSVSDTRSGTTGITDHVIVEGRGSNATTINLLDDIDLTIMEIPEKALATYVMKEYDEELEDLSELKKMDEYNDSFGTGDDEFTPNLLGFRHHREYYARNTLEQELILLKEVVETYDDSRDNLIHRVTTEHRYGPNYEPIGSTEKIEAQVYLPGESSTSWNTLKYHHIKQDQFVKGLRRALASEIVEQLVLYEQTEAGEKISPIAYIDLLRMDKNRDTIEKDVGTNQSILQMTTNIRTTKIDRIDSKTLIQKIFDYDRIAGAMRVQRQIIKNPMEPEDHSRDIPFREEFLLDGGGKTIGTFGTCYHSPKSVRHDDITTYDQMEAIADRWFARESTRNLIVTLKTPALIPIDMMGVVVELPSLTYEVNGVEVEVSGGDYILKRNEIEFSYSPNGKGTTKLDHWQTLTLRSNF